MLSRVVSRKIWLVSGLSVNLLESGWLLASKFPVVSINTKLMTSSGHQRRSCPVGPVIRRSGPVSLMTSGYEWFIVISLTMLEHEFVMETSNGMYKNFISNDAREYENFKKNWVYVNSRFFPTMLTFFNP